MASRLNLVRTFVLLTACALGSLAYPSNACSWQEAPGETKKLEAEVEPLLPLESPVLNGNSSFAELSERFETVRKARKHFPNGQIELFELYERAMGMTIQGSFTVNARLRLLKKWSEERPEDPTPLIILSRLLVVLGWEARGAGFAGQVTANGGRVFVERLTEAATHAEAAEKLKPADPELYRVLIEIGKGLGNAERADLDRWVKAAREIDPNYYPVYQAAAEFLLPRWHGEPGEIEKFAGDLQEAVGGDDGLAAYMRIAQRVNMYDHDLLYQGDFDGEKIEQGALVLAKRFPRAPLIADFQALLAWKAFRHDDARRLARQLAGSGPELRNWGSQRRYDAFLKYANAPAAADKPVSYFWTSSSSHNRFALANKDERLVTIPFAVTGPLLFWDLKQPHKLVGGINALPTPPSDIQASVSGERLLLQADDKLKFAVVTFAWSDLDKPVVIRRADMQPNAILSPDGKFVATLHAEAFGKEQQVRLWNAVTGEELRTIQLKDAHNQLFFSPDSKLIMIQSGRPIWIYRVETGEQVHHLTGEFRSTPYDGIKPAGFVDEATFLAVGRRIEDSKQVVLEWNAPKNEWTVRLETDTRDSLSIAAFNKDVFVLSKPTVGKGVGLEVYQRASGKSLGTIDGHFNLVTSGKLSADGKTLFTAEEYGPIRLWKMPVAGK